MTMLLLQQISAFVPTFFFIAVETTSQEFNCYCMIGIEAIG